MKIRWFRSLCIRKTDEKGLEEIFYHREILYLLFSAEASTDMFISISVFTDAGAGEIESLVH